MSNGQRPARTAQDVAQLEADNEYLRNENERQGRELAVVTADRQRLLIENAMLDAKGREHLLRATRIETIVNVHSSGLVAALQEIKQERATERAVRRQVQEDQLTEETGPAPTFLRTRDNSQLETRFESEVAQDEGGDHYDQAAAEPGVRVQPEARRESDEDREDRLRGAAERIAPRPMIPSAPLSMRPGRVDLTLAARDPRIPAMGDYPADPVVHPTRMSQQQEDDANLRRLAGQIEQRTRG